MSGTDETNRAVAICRSCKSIHPVEVLDDGAVRPLGAMLRLDCGCAEPAFEVMSEDPELRSDSGGFG